MKEKSVLAPVKRIVDVFTHENGERYFRVNWRDTWEQESHLISCEDLLEKFWIEKTLEKENNEDKDSLDAVVPLSCQCGKSQKKEAKKSFSDKNIQFAPKRIHQSLQVNTFLSKKQSRGLQIGPCRLSNSNVGVQVNTLQPQTEREYDIGIQLNTLPTENVQSGDSTCNLKSFDTSSQVESNTQTEHSILSSPQLHKTNNEQKCTLQRNSWINSDTSTHACAIQNVVTQKDQYSQFETSFTDFYDHDIIQKEESVQFSPVTIQCGVQTWVYNHDQSTQCSENIFQREVACQYNPQTVSCGIQKNTLQVDKYTQYEDGEGVDNNSFSTDKLDFSNVDHEVNHSFNQSFNHSFVYPYITPKKQDENNGSVPKSCERKIVTYVDQLRSVSKILEGSVPGNYSNSQTMNKSNLSDSCMYNIKKKNRNDLNALLEKNSMKCSEIMNDASKRKMTSLNDNKVTGGCDYIDAKLITSVASTVTFKVPLSTATPTTPLSSTPIFNFVAPPKSNTDLQQNPIVENVNAENKLQPENTICIPLDINPNMTTLLQPVIGPNQGQLASIALAESSTPVHQAMKSQAPIMSQQQLPITDDHSGKIQFVSISQQGQMLLNQLQSTQMSLMLQSSESSSIVHQTIINQTPIISQKQPILTEQYLRRGSQQVSSISQQGQVILNQLHSTQMSSMLQQSSENVAIDLQGSSSIQIIPSSSSSPETYADNFQKDTINTPSIKLTIPIVPPSTSQTSNLQISPFIDNSRLNTITPPTINVSASDSIFLDPHLQLLTNNTASVQSDSTDLQQLLTSATSAQSDTVLNQLLLSNSMTSSHLATSTVDFQQLSVKNAAAVKSGEILPPLPSLDQMVLTNPPPPPPPDTPEPTDHIAMMCHYFKSPTTAGTTSLPIKTSPLNRNIDKTNKKKRQRNHKDCLDLKSRKRSKLKVLEETAEIHCSVYELVPPSEVMKDEQSLSSVRSGSTNDDLDNDVSKYIDKTEIPSSDANEINDDFISRYWK